MIYKCATVLPRGVHSLARKAAQTGLTEVSKAPSSPGGRGRCGWRATGRRQNSLPSICRAPCPGLDATFLHYVLPTPPPPNPISAWNPTLKMNQRLGEVKELGQNVVLFAGPTETGSPTC